ncbi:hypothetical protein DFR70_101725 [Nocardia tenerifensis]|uniref:Uncharacterized protein n=1 Tax=Nocardia tenerifensis TaxID=228006 RepID=A0A318KGI5_9NOCA|nr:hypothetical protein [Nocardia tenerifensis]PXX71303.1 hypothetical protein DFR70_101725 [Nocardia tenerifensis]
MMAIAAAVAFGLALLFDLTHTTLGDSITAGTLTTLGLLLVALHLAGVGTGARSWNWRRRR